MSLANSRNTCSISFYGSKRVTITYVIKVSEDLVFNKLRKSQVWLVDVNVKWLNCNQYKLKVVWMEVQVFLLWQLFESNTCICHALLQIDIFLHLWKWHIYMYLLNGWLNSCTGFWLMVKTEKELKVWTTLDEMTSASLTSLWLCSSKMSAALCHWIIIKHTCDVNSAISLHLLLHYLLFCKNSRLLLKVEVRPRFEKYLYFKACRLIFSFLQETNI